MLKIKYCGLSGAKACKSCRSRQELSNAYFVAKIGFDTAENEPSEICPIEPMTLRHQVKWSLPTLLSEPDVFIPYSLFIAVFGCIIGCTIVLCCELIRLYCTFASIAATPLPRTDFSDLDILAHRELRRVPKYNTLLDMSSIRNYPPRYVLHPRNWGTGETMDQGPWGHGTSPFDRDELARRD